MAGAQGAGTPGVETAIPIQVVGDRGPLDSELAPKTVEVPVVAASEVPVAAPTPVFAPEVKSASGSPLDAALQQVDVAAGSARVVDAVGAKPVTPEFSIEGQQKRTEEQIVGGDHVGMEADLAKNNVVRDGEEIKGEEDDVEPPEAVVLPEGDEKPLAPTGSLRIAPLPAATMSLAPVLTPGPALSPPVPTLPQPPAPAYPPSEQAVVMPTPTGLPVPPDQGPIVDEKGLQSERGGNYIASSVEVMNRMTLDQLNEAIASGEKQLLISNAERRRILDNSAPELGLRDLLNLEATIRTIKSYLEILENVREDKENAAILAKSQQPNQTEQGPSGQGVG